MNFQNIFVQPENDPQNYYWFDKGFTSEELDKVSKLNGYLYNLKDDKDKKEKYGVIAQEISKEFPEMVEKGPNGLLAVDYNQLIGVLLEAVKELNDSVTKAAYGIGAALMFIPGLGIAAKALGAAVALFGLAMEGSTKLIEMGAKYNDDVYKSFNELSEAGLTTAKGMSGVSNTMEQLGLTSAEIEKMNALLVSGSKDLADAVAGAVFVCVENMAIDGDVEIEILSPDKYWEENEDIPNFGTVQVYNRETGEYSSGFNQQETDGMKWLENL